MAAIVWAPTLATMDAALATASETDLAVGTGIRAWLAALGAKYDSLYSAETETAKASSVTQTAAALAAWEADAEAKHDQADEAARYVLYLYGTPPAPLAFDANNAGAVLSRITDAMRLASNDGNAARVTMLQAHHVAVLAARNAKPEGFVRAEPYDASIGWAGPSSAGLAPTVVHRPSTFRDLESALSAQVTHAAEWTALVAYS